MLTILQQELKRYLRNPILYIGIIIVFIVMYQNIKPYFNYGYLNENKTIREKNPSDSDVADGYIPYTSQEKKK